MKRARSSARLLAALPLLLALSACDRAGSAPVPPAAAEPPRPAEAAKTDAERGFVVTGLTPSAGDLRAALKAEAAKAAQKGLKPHVELWASWCGPCVALRQSLHDPRMEAAFKGAYIVQLNVDDWGGDKLSSAGFSGSSIPVFYAIDADAKPTGKHIDGGAWGDNIPENMAPPLDRYFHGT